jgi:hypothetical protein
MDTDLCLVAIKDPANGLDNDYRYIPISRKRLADLAPESMLNRMFDPTQQLAVEKLNEAYLLTGARTTLGPLLEYISCGEEPCFTMANMEELHKAFDFYGIPVPKLWQAKMEMVSSLKENKNAIKNAIRELAEAIISSIPQHIHAYTEKLHRLEDLELEVYTDRKDVFISSKYKIVKIELLPFRMFFPYDYGRETLRDSLLLVSELPAAIKTAVKGVVDDVTVYTRDSTVKLELSFVKSI